MKTNRLQDLPRLGFYLFVTALIIVGLAQIFTRHYGYGVPWLPSAVDKVWDVEAKIEFEGKGDPVRVSMAAPKSQQGFTHYSDSSSSPGYGLSIIRNGQQKRAEWTTRSAKGKQTLYFKAQFLEDERAEFVDLEPGQIEVPTISGAAKIAADEILAEANQRSSDHVSFARELMKEFNRADNQNTALVSKDFAKLDAVSELLAYSRIPSRSVGVIQLEDGRRRQSLKQMIQVWDGTNWQLITPDSENGNNYQDALVWDESNISLIDVIGGSNSKVTFSMIRREVSTNQAIRHKVSAEGLLNFSIHSLPLEEQAMFSTILLIPIGSLIVVVLRILIGLKTSGTFMPILIAVTFVQTELITGIAGFLLIVSVGLLIRSYLSKLNLLLVARISAVITVVILMITFFTIVTYRMGVTEGLSITFFPMIILAWTIERMSILWEEEGAQAVLVQGGGSLITAVIVYLVMTHPIVRHLSFNFIGIQLVILGIILILGSYTGYRLSELKRFKPLTEIS